MESTAAQLEVRLLGSFRVAVGDRPLPDSAWRRKRAADIVKLLALEPTHRLHREQIVEALWPDLDPDAAANNLRVALHRARQRLEEAGGPPGSISDPRRRQPRPRPARRRERSTSMPSSGRSPPPGNRPIRPPASGPSISMAGSSSPRIGMKSGPKAVAPRSVPPTSRCWRERPSSTNSAASSAGRSPPWSGRRRPSRWPRSCTSS